MHENQPPADTPTDIAVIGAGVRLPAFDNVDVYPLLARLSMKPMKPPPITAAS